MKSIDLIVFDLDGTLIDSRENIVNAINFTLSQLGLKEKGRQEITSYVGTGIEDLMSKSLGKEGEHLFEKAVFVFEAEYRSRARKNSTLYPHVKDILTHFSDKKKIILTNGRRENALLVLRSCGIDTYFEDIIGGDNLECRKPSPCPLDKIILKFKVDKQRSIIVGDMDIDILTGKNAAILTCGVTYGIGNKEDMIKAEPDYIIGSMIQLKDIIN